MALSEQEWRRLESGFDGLGKSIETVKKDLGNAIEIVRKENNVAHKDIYENQSRDRERIIRLEMHKDSCIATPKKINEHETRIFTVECIQKECKTKAKEAKNIFWQMVIKWGPGLVVTAGALALVLKGI